LVRAVGAGDERALEALYGRAHRIVYTLSVRITRDRETAEEVTLDVFHDVWRRAAAYDPDRGPVVGWIMNLARSRAIDRQRFDRRKKRADHGVHDPRPAVDSPEPHEALELEDERGRLEAALTRLSKGEQQAIEAAFFSERSYAEAALQLKQPVGTIKSRIRTGLEKLRHALGGVRREP
jgi:RNA polymerase sigma-70 factor (ECF subfamily)